MPTRRFFSKRTHLLVNGILRVKVLIIDLIDQKCTGVEGVLFESALLQAVHRFEEPATRCVEAGIGVEAAFAIGAVDQSDSNMVQLIAGDGAVFPRRGTT